MVTSAMQSGRFWFTRQDRPRICMPMCEAAMTSITERVRIPARGEQVPRILIQGKPTSVQVNDGTVPETQASVHITRLDAAAQ